MDILTHVEMKDLITEYAEKFDLPPEIVFGVIMKESALDLFAARFEPTYKYLWKPDLVKPKVCTKDTEVTLQKTSFGLMQVMGAVYREHGFEGWLTQVVTSPRLQLEYGCKHLATKIKRYGVEGGILAYNAGSVVKGRDGKPVNQQYLDAVLNYSKQFAEF